VFPAMRRQLVVAKLLPRHTGSKLPVIDTTWTCPCKFSHVHKMLGINYESSDEEDAIPTTKTDVSPEDAYEGRR